MTSPSGGAAVLGGPLVVVGGGTMGAGIALLAGLHGQNVTIVESDAAAAVAARARVDRALEAHVRRGRLDADRRREVAGRIRVGVDHDPARDAGAVAVIEAVPEILGVKHAVLRRAAAALPEATLASNTSSIPIREIAVGMPRPEQVVGLHFFNPPTAMRLVELVAPPTAAPEHVAVARRVAAALGRTAIDAADVPGFVVNRCARPYSLEPLRVVGSEGSLDVGALATIDAACVAAGFPLGPFALMDLIGIDVGLAATRTMWDRADHEPRWEPSPLQERLVAAGRLGRKSGHGFYAYDAPPARRDGPPDRTAAAEAAAARAAAAIDLALAGGAPPFADLALARILVQLVNEARFAVAEGVATAAAIDLGLKLGVRHPLGPTQWERRIGAARIDAYLDRLAGPGADPVYRRAPSPSARGASR